MKISIPVYKAKVAKVECIGEFEDEYVYDVGVNDETPYFFGNNILVHNSCYLTSYHRDLKNGDLKEVVDLKEYYIEKYDNIGVQVNESFPHFMHKAFNVSLEKGSVIKANRELVAERGLFIAKKRYALLMYDKDSNRKDLDKDGNPLFDEKTNRPIYGEIKAMGLETKRSDTSPPIQEFLEEVILMVLLNKSETEVLEYIKEFRNNFRNWNPWDMGTPKKVNALSKFAELEEQQKETPFSNLKSRKTSIPTKKVSIPGHVRAALAWNKLRRIHEDNYSMEIGDGQKVMVCKLKPNNMNITSIAIPVDESHPPEWFKCLRFDTEEMEAAVIDKKLLNIIGVLKYNLESTRSSNTFDDLFEF